MALSYPDLFTKCEEYFCSITISPEQSKNIEKHKRKRPVNQFLPDKIKLSQAQQEIGSLRSQLHVNLLLSTVSFPRTASLLYFLLFLGSLILTYTF